MQGLEGHGVKRSGKPLEALRRGAPIYMLKRWLSGLQRMGWDGEVEVGTRRLNKGEFGHQMSVAWILVLAVGM